MNEFNDLNTPKPTVTEVSKPFWDAISSHQLMLQKCKDCQNWCFYPRDHCPKCWGDQLEWQEASGKGYLKTWCKVHKPGHPSWEEVTPYLLGLIELDEGTTMLSQLLLGDSKPTIGLPLQVIYVKCGETWLPFFKPLQI